LKKFINKIEDIIKTDPGFVFDVIFLVVVTILLLIITGIIKFIITVAVGVFVYFVYEYLKKTFITKPERKVKND
jgi:hypothetical protein